MDPLTHVATGAAISQMVPSPHRGWAALAGVLFAVLPDLDYILTFNSRLAYLKHHRGFTHSVFGLLLFVMLAAGLGRLLGGPRWFRPLLLIGFLVLVSHLFQDWTTSYGTQLLNPLTRAKFTLDWVFIIDPYLTALIFLGAAAALISAGWGRTLNEVCLGLAGGYILLCGFYHHQALNLARQIYEPTSGPAAKIAALPQPFSPRRWVLLAATPSEVRQAFVELPFWPSGVQIQPSVQIPVTHAPGGPYQAPPAAYRRPPTLEIYLWQAAPFPPAALTPEVRRLLSTYLEFSRFPLLVANDHVPPGITLSWLDLRFSVPGRAMPFVLQVTLDPEGRLTAWRLGGARLPVEKSSPPSPCSG